MEWIRAQTPEHPAPGLARGPELEDVPDGFVSPFVRGRARTTNGRQWWVRGAAYRPDGRLLPQSQRLLLQGKPRPVPVDPEQLSDVDIRGLDRLPGTWLYVGAWQPHFGHFLSEVVSMLWPEIPVDGVLCHPNPQNITPDGLLADWAHPERLPYQQRMLELAGYGDKPVVMALQRGLRVDRLLVPRRAMVLEAWVEPEALRVWDRVAAHAGPPGEAGAVYLSRTSFNATPERQKRGVRTSAELDVETDRLFAEAGFRVVSPELLSVDDQVRLARDASVLAGWSGSALHLSAFAPASTRVLVLGDTRSRRRVHANQQAIDAARGRLTAFVPADVVSAGGVPDALHALGLQHRS